MEPGGWASLIHDLSQVRVVYSSRFVRCAAGAVRTALFQNRSARKPRSGACPRTRSSSWEPGCRRTVSRARNLSERTAHAVALFRQGVAPRIICTGGFSGDRLSAAAVARSVAVAYGVPTQDILLADGSLNTQEDAHQAAAIVKAHGWQTILLVSHPLHLYRARLLFEQEGLTVFTSPTNTNLSAIPLRWRLGYDVREALFITWTGMETLGLPREWGFSLHQWLYDWSRRAGLPGGIPL